MPHGELGILFVCPWCPSNPNIGTVAPHTTLDCMEIRTVSTKCAKKMDGRDSPPNSGKGYLSDIEAKMSEIGVGQIASIMGRFYAMDRDQRWDRVEATYNCLTSGKGGRAGSAEEAMQKRNYVAEKCRRLIIAWN